MGCLAEIVFSGGVRQKATARVGERLIFIARDSFECREAVATQKVADVRGRVGK